MSKHKWSEYDRLVALFMFRFGVTSLGDPVEIGERLGMGVDSLMARMSNFLSVATNGEFGYAKFPAEDEHVYKRFGILERTDLEKIVRHYLNSERAPDR